MAIPQKLSLSYDPDNPLLIQRKWNQYTVPKKYTLKYTGTVFTTAKIQIQPKYPLVVCGKCGTQMEYYSVTKSNEILLFVARWVEPEDTNKPDTVHVLDILRCGCEK